MRRPDTDDLNAAQQRAWSKNPDVDINNALLDGVVTGTPDGWLSMALLLYNEQPFLLSARVRQGKCRRLGATDPNPAPQ